MKDLTFRIRHARRKAALSQSEMAEKIGVNRSAVAQWERQGGSTPTSANLSKIAVVTAIQYEWLATGRGRMTPASDIEGAGAGADELLLLRYYAHDEMEERLLFGLRKLEYWQSMLIVEMVEGFARGRLD